MAARETSIQTYRAVLASGLIGRVQRTVYDFVYQNQNVPAFGGMISQGDVARAFGDTRRSYGRRLSELVLKGVVREAGYKTDPGSSQEVIGYRTTDNLPVKVVGPQGLRGSKHKTALLKISELLGQDVAGLEPIVLDRIREICGGVL